MIITWEGNGSLREHSLVTLVMVIGEPVVGSPPQVESEMRVKEREGSGLSPPVLPVRWGFFESPPSLASLESFYSVRLSLLQINYMSSYNNGLLCGVGIRAWRAGPDRNRDASLTHGPPVYEPRCGITPGRAATKKKNQHNSRMQFPVPEGWVGGHKNRGGRHWAGYDSTGLIVPVNSPPSGDAQVSDDAIASPPVIDP